MTDRETGLQKSKRRTLFAAIGVIGVMTGLVAYSPTLYRLFCAVTGYGGTVQRAEATSLDKTGSGGEVTVRFDANVSQGLDWTFEPEQRSVTTHYNEPTKVYYRAINNSNETVVARATFNITPYAAAPYFFKIECFCFTEERLGPGESARMPLVLYVDEEMQKDEIAGTYDEITLSYTFFEQEGLSEEDIAAARDLGEGSEKIDARLRAEGSARFDNDAPRR